MFPLHQHDIACLGGVSARAHVRVRVLYLDGVCLRRHREHGDGHCGHHVQGSKPPHRSCLVYMRSMASTRNRIDLSCPFLLSDRAISWEISRDIRMREHVQIYGAMYQVGVVFPRGTFAENAHVPRQTYGRSTATCLYTRMRRKVADLWSLPPPSFMGDARGRKSQRPSSSIDLVEN